MCVKWHRFLIYVEGSLATGRTMLVFEGHKRSSRIEIEVTMILR